jgi:hypothetical protein
MDASPFELIRVLTRIRRHLAFRRALGWAVRAGWIAAAVVSTALLFGLIVPAAAAPPGWLLPLVPLAVLAAAAAAWARRPALAACAAWADRVCGLEERAATAWDVVARGSAEGDWAFGSVPPRTELSPLHVSLVGDAMAALGRADLDGAARLTAPRETPFLVAALAVLGALFAIPGAPPAGAADPPGRFELREAARRLGAALARPGVPDGQEAVEREVRRLMEGLEAGAISAEEARARLRALGGRIETARTEAGSRSPDPAAGRTERWLRLLLDDVRLAQQLAGAAGGGGGASAGRAGGTVEDFRLLEGAFARGFADPRLARRDEAPADFSTAAFPWRADGTGTAEDPAPRGDGLGAETLERLLDAARQARAERKWPRGRYDPVVDRYFGE